MGNSPRRILKTVFGYDDFLENQREVIESVFSGRDVFALMPTGGGKSLCYQIPAMLDHGVAIVISPLIALMEDQVKGLRQYGVRAAYLNSSLSFQEAQDVQRRAANGGLDILYVAPEKLLTENFQHFLTHIKPMLFAIDEAHCVSQWGHDFRPEYLRITEVTRRFPDTPRMALTATADAITRGDILEKLDLRQAEVFISSLDRPNIRYRVQPKQGEKRQLLRFINDEHPKGSGIVYVRTRKRSESIAAWLDQEGIAALPYHAGLPAEERFKNQGRFQEEETLIIVATIAFGMGIDKPDVRFVAHLDLPANMEAYYQETGRAGRDGKPSDAWMLYSFADVSALRCLFELSEGNEEFKQIRRKKLDALLGYCESAVCRRKLLLNYFDENHDGQCGNCDNCLKPAEVWDGTVAAQKALSCVYRTGQRFGVRHLANVLTGKTTQKIEKWRHDRIKTFGVGRELDVKTWESVYRQLLSAGLLSVEPGRVSSVRLTDDSWPVLKGEQTVFFRKDLAQPKAGKARHPSEPVDLAHENQESQALFEVLRNLRLEIARQLKVPPYVIFHDKSLKEMALAKPATVKDFSRITGVGMAKTERFSAVFLACIRGEEIDLSRYSEIIKKPQGDAAVGDSGH